MDIEKVKGIIVPIVTPVNQENQIKTAPLERMVEHVIQGGVNGILAFGSNGEFLRLIKRNKRKVSKQSLNQPINVYQFIWVLDRSRRRKEC